MFSQWQNEGWGHWGTCLSYPHFGAALVSAVQEVFPPVHAAAAHSTAQQPPPASRRPAAVWPLSEGDRSVSGRGYQVLALGVHQDHWWWSGGLQGGGDGDERQLIKWFQHPCKRHAWGVSWDCHCAESGSETRSRRNKTAPKPRSSNEKIIKEQEMNASSIFCWVFSTTKLISLLNLSCLTGVHFKSCLKSTKTEQQKCSVFSVSAMTECIPKPMDIAWSSP